MKRLSMLILGGILMASCEREEPFIGPSACDQFCEFNLTSDLTTDQNDGVDFESETVQFCADFTVRTSWVLTIEGRETGGVKRLRGTSQGISGNDAEWRGISDGTWFDAEVCDVKLTFPEHPDDSLLTTVEVTNPFDYSTKGILITDFNGINGVSNYGGASASALAVDENGSMNLEGTENGGQWWLGGAAVNASPNYFPITETDPSKVYFNAYVYGTGSFATRMIVNFHEDEDMDGNFNKASEDGWEKAITIDWTGWKLVSFSMADTEETDDNGFGNGNHIRNIDRIKTIEFMLFSNGTADPDPKAYNIDYALFTEGAPL